MFLISLFSRFKNLNNFLFNFLYPETDKVLVLPIWYYTAQTACIVSWELSSLWCVRLVGCQSKVILKHVLQTRHIVQVLEALMFKNGILMYYIPVYKSMYLVIMWTN